MMERIFLEDLNLKEIISFNDTITYTGSYMDDENGNEISYDTEENEDDNIVRTTNSYNPQED